ncbi:uncharacterized protein [Dysidea avara]|uniref:uncharacterized protein n=1 Tax=Dysidea avara TaxID=196820 RepID=UPI00332615D5
MKRNECTRSRCPTNSTTDVNVVAIATITPIVGGIPILISVIILCWICGGCKATKEYCEGCCECCFDGCVRCVKVFDLRTYSRNTTTRNQTYSPPTIISVPPTLDNVIIMPLGHIEPSTNAPDSTSEQRPVNDSRQLSNNSNESYYSIHGNDDNNPPDYRHALQYRSTENEEVESSSANQQPPCYDTVN